MTLPAQIRLVNDLIRADPDTTIRQYLNIERRLRAGKEYIFQNGIVISKAETKRAI